MQTLLDHLEHLIGFDTTSRETNLKMIAYLEDTCRKLGAETTRIPASCGDKAGLVARFGADAPGGIVLSGHCDVVPTSGQNWTRPDFRLTQEDSRLYGRGTTDMKGFLACMLEAGRIAAAAKLTRPLTLIFSYDEEIGCVGIQEMAAHLPPHLNAPRLCIVGEPTEMQIAIGHKGKVALKATCFGQTGHSALAPNFVNALHLAADFIHHLRALQHQYAGGAQDSAYEIPYTTFHIGKISGGTALNIVPARAEMLFEYRYLPADDPAQILQNINDIADAVAAPFRAQYPEARIEIDRLNAYPAFDIAADAEAIAFAQSFMPHRPLTKLVFGTEAGVFSALGIPTLVCGPGSMAQQGHKADEFIELSALTACVSMLEKAIAKLAD